MKRWNAKAAKQLENPKIDAFLNDVLEVCAKHGLCIMHEDNQGAFEVRPIDEDDGGLLYAEDCT